MTVSVRAHPTLAFACANLLLRTLAILLTPFFVVYGESTRVFVWSLMFRVAHVRYVYFVNLLKGFYPLACPTAPSPLREAFLPRAEPACSNHTKLRRR